MKRDIEKYLINWKINSNRRPLLLRGARQVGKSYTVTNFGKEHFKDVIVINFELEPQYKSCFSSLEPQSILQQIMILSKREIIPGETLVFLDEIQECPQAIRSLRYFFEKLPVLHIIGAGSLVEFSLSSEDFRMPVGRVQYLYMEPISFGEYINIVDSGRTRDYLLEFSIKSPFPEAIHEKLLGLVRQYMLTGGMPAVVSSFVSGGNISQIFQLQASLIQSYQDDFAKYAGKAKIEYLRKLFSVIPRMVGQKFKYVSVDPDIKSLNLKSSLSQLVSAGIVHLIKKTSGAGLPLEAHADDRNFKCLFLDTGLMQNVCGMSIEVQSAQNLVSIYAGALAEQFAGQQFLSMTEPFNKSSLYYWAREAPGSTAEVDYLFVHNGMAFPVDIKYGKTGKLKSLRSFIETFKTPLGIRISQMPFSFDNKILSVPLYAIELLPRILSELL